jgi:hypothetical protein
VRPDFRLALELRHAGTKLLAQFRGDDDVRRRSEIDAMVERGAAKIGVDQRNDDADAGEPEPDGQIFGPVRHHQADDLALGEVLRQRPARKTAGARDELGIGQAFSSREERGSVPLRFRELGDDGVEGALALDRDRRRRLERAHPVAQRRLLAAAAARRAFRLDQRHAQ